MFFLLTKNSVCIIITHVSGSIAQLGEHLPYKQGVTGSSPVVPTRKRQVSTETCRFQLYSPFGELYAPSVRDICFASDMPAGVRGEYFSARYILLRRMTVLCTLLNITEIAGFNITFCIAKYITPSKTEYH